MPDSLVPAGAGSNGEFPSWEKAAGRVKPTAIIKSHANLIFVLNNTSPQALGKIMNNSVYS
jgi:hypothetical protein